MAGETPANPASLVVCQVRPLPEIPLPNPPPAEGVRVHWEQLPAQLRAAIEERIGSRVVEAVTQPGGFSPGLAARLRTTDGRRVFVKAVSEAGNPDSPDIHRREARVVAALPAEAPVPRLLWSHDEGGWVVLCFEDIDGRLPAQPWMPEELSEVVAAMQQLSSLLAPSPLPLEPASPWFARNICGWRELLETPDPQFDGWSTRNLQQLADLEATAPEWIEGDTLLHNDIRADNILLSDRGVYFVDWPWARTGAAFVDWVLFAPSVTMQGGPGPEELLRRFDVGSVSATAITAVVATLAGFFLAASRRPPPQGLPTLRAFQAAQGEIAVEWLRERTAWD